jgi:hypothetical protein
MPILHLSRAISYGRGDVLAPAAWLESKSKFGGIVSRVAIATIILRGWNLLSTIAFANVAVKRKSPCKKSGAKIAEGGVWTHELKIMRRCSISDCANI